MSHTWATQTQPWCGTGVGHPGLPIKSVGCSGCTAWPVSNQFCAHHGGIWLPPWNAIFCSSSGPAASVMRVVCLAAEPGHSSHNQTCVLPQQFVPWDLLSDLLVDLWWHHGPGQWAQGFKVIPHHGVIGKTQVWDKCGTCPTLLASSGSTGVGQCTPKCGKSGSGVEWQTLPTNKEINYRGKALSLLRDSVR